jgi:hypothetical protein
MIFAILRQTPVWVWTLLAGLVALGLYQARDREMTLMRITILPLALITLSFSGVINAFGVFPMALGGWLAGVGIALSIGRHVVVSRSARWSAETGRVHVPGSWLPLVLILGLFCIKYYAGVTLAMTPAAAHHAAFAGLCGLAYGSFSGLFLARAIGLRSLATRAAAPSGA